MFLLPHPLYFSIGNLKEDQVQKVRTTNTVKFQQLDTAIQDKLIHAQNRREILEQEQKEKLRNYVSFH